MKFWCWFGLVVICVCLKVCMCVIVSDCLVFCCVNCVIMCWLKRFFRMFGSGWLVFVLVGSLKWCLVFGCFVLFIIVLMIIGVLFVIVLLCWLMLICVWLWLRMGRFWKLNFLNLNNVVVFSWWWSNCCWSSVKCCNCGWIRNWVWRRLVRLLV